VQRFIGKAANGVIQADAETDENAAAAAAAAVTALSTR